MNRAMMMHVRDKSREPEHGERYNPYSNSYYTPQPMRREDHGERYSMERHADKYPDYDASVWADDEDNRRQPGRREERSRAGNRQAIRAGGTFWMDAPQADEMTRETAEKWVASMRNEDPEKPMGGKWSADEIRPLAQKNNVPTEGPAFWEFFAMVNAMYSDYSEVAKKFGVKSPDFFACMAKAWMNDKDAKDDKTEIYYRDIVKK